MSIKTYQVDYVAISKIDGPPDNPNSMSAANFDTLCRLIQEEGFLQPLLTRQRPKGRVQVVDGDHRFKAAQKLGMTELPCVILPADYPDAKARVLQLALNKIRGDFNLADVSVSLQKIMDAGVIDATLSGFNQGEIDDLLAAVNPQESLEDLLEGAGSKAGRPPKEELYVLELPFSNATELKAAKKLLRKLGSGDLTEGLKVALEPHV